MPLPHHSPVAQADSSPSATASRPRDAVASLPRLSRLLIQPMIVVALALLLPLISLAGYGVVERWSRAIPSATPTSTPVWSTTQLAIRSDFADPAILVVGSTYYAYATNTYGKHIQAARASDLRHWTLLPDALPALPGWAAAADSRVWAPAVMQIGARFVMYYTARDAASGRQCVGVATSTTPEGPFTDTNARPLVCQLSLGGTIDPAPFRDGDTLYLYFKSDGNCCRQATHLWGQRLTPDGLALVGEPVMLVTNDHAWEGAVVEAPNMLAHDGSYLLFYSGNDYATARYAVGYARCQTPLGPCAKPADSPILASNTDAAEPVIGPGGEALFEANGTTWIAFHAWSIADSGARGDSRYMLIGRLGWHGEVPVVLGP